MKLCILSMQRVANYGSLLQAYSLKKILTQMGHEVNFIDIEPNATENNVARREVNFSESRVLVGKSFFYRLWHQDTNPFLIIRKVKSKRKETAAQVQFMDEILRLSSQYNREAYDCCIIGSDEVFNCIQNTEWGFTSQLFGNVPQAKKVITYAACCGFTRVENLSDSMAGIIRNAFINIQAFSARDENTKNFISALSPKEVQMHLDPVVIGDFSQEIAAAAVNLKLPKRFCIIYSYHERIHTPEEISCIQKLCKKENLTIVSIGGAQEWVHRHLALSPFEVLEAFQKAQFVVTDTFHGAVFSAKYARRFAVIVRPSNANKLGDLLTRLQVENHRLVDMGRIEEIYAKEHDKKEINALILRERNRAISYLEKNI